MFRGDLLPELEDPRSMTGDAVEQIDQFVHDRFAVRIQFVNAFHRVDGEFDLIQFQRDLTIESQAAVVIAERDGVLGQGQRIHRILLELHLAFEYGHRGLHHAGKFGETDQGLRPFLFGQTQQVARFLKARHRLDQVVQQRDAVVVILILFDQVFGLVVDVFQPGGQFVQMDFFDRHDAFSFPFPFAIQIFSCNIYLHTRNCQVS